ncbi:hypothetical protein BDV39DRAFT_180003, partial [Aspergillus sergii]
MAYGLFFPFNIFLPLINFILGLLLISRHTVLLPICVCVFPFYHLSCSQNENVFR